MQSLRMLRPAQIADKQGNKIRKTWDDVKQGLLPPFVAIGARAKGLPEYEVDAVLRARIAGKTDDEIRALVRSLVEQREKMAEVAA